MEIGTNTPLIISIGTLISIIIFAIRVSSQITKFKEQVAFQLKDHAERLRELENLDLKRILTEMQINLKRIVKKMEEMEKKIK